MNEEVNGWIRVSPDNPCPKCGSDHWCLTAANGSAAICPRIEEGSVRYIDDAGYLHRLKRGKARANTTRTFTVPLLAPPSKALAKMSESFQAAADPGAVEDLAAALGVSAKSLRRLGIGWSEQQNAWSFPMCNARGQVLGIRLRSDDGRKFAVQGSHAGLHIPTDLGRPRTLLLPEGPTDAATALDLGFAAVGRASCAGGIDLTIDLVRRLAPELIVLVADNDPADPNGHRPGIEGATHLASALAISVKAVKVIMSPTGIKDLRDWKIAGATAADVKAAINAATAIKVTIVDRNNTQEEQS